MTPNVEIAGHLVIRKFKRRGRHDFQYMKKTSGSRWMIVPNSDERDRMLVNAAGFRDSQSRENCHFLILSYFIWIR